MRGPPKLRLLDQPVTGSLEDLVSADTFSRYLDAMLDLSAGGRLRGMVAAQRAVPWWRRLRGER